MYLLLDKLLRNGNWNLENLVTEEIGKQDVSADFWEPFLCESFQFSRLAGGVCAGYQNNVQHSETKQVVWKVISLKLSYVHFYKFVSVYTARAGKYVVFVYDFLPKRCLFNAVFALHFGV